MTACCKENGPPPSKYVFQNCCRGEKRTAEITLGNYSCESGLLWPLQSCTLHDRHINKINHSYKSLSVMKISALNCFLSCYIFSLKLDCEKLVQEKTEMQRHYVMVSFALLINRDKFENGGASGFPIY